MYELFNSSFQSVGTAAELVAARGPDAVSLAKAYVQTHGRDCIVVRCSDSVALMGYGHRPSRILARWRAEMMPGVARVAA